MLVGVLGTRQVSVGANFRFGHRARGDVDLLRSRPEFETTVVPLVEHGDAPVSSSRIRELVAGGDVAAAADLLGAPYRMEGEVVSGDARGRELDMRTANIAPAPGVLVPQAGIYAATARRRRARGSRCGQHRRAPDVRGRTASCGSRRT